MTESAETDAHTPPSSEPHTQLETILYDATNDLKSIASCIRSRNRIFLPKQYQQVLMETLAYLSTSLESSNISTPKYTPATSALTNESPTSALISLLDSSHHKHDKPTVQMHVKLNRRTILDKLIFHPPGALVEYPETSKHGRIGHIFSMEDVDWFNPARNFAYSQGEPRGSSGTKTVTCALLTDEKGNEVPCQESHSTCEQ